MNLLNYEADICMDLQEQMYVIGHNNKMLNCDHGVMLWYIHNSLLHNRSQPCHWDILRAIGDQPYGANVISHS